MSEPVPAVKIYAAWKVFATCSFCLFGAMKLYFHWGVDIPSELRNWIGTICILFGIPAFALVVRNVIAKNHEPYIPLPRYAVRPFEVAMYSIIAVTFIKLGLDFDAGELFDAGLLIAVGLIGVWDTIKSRRYYRDPATQSRKN